MSITKLEILRLYKNLMLYSRSLTLTDPVYFRSKISSEFRRNKILKTPEDIDFAYQDNLFCVEAALFKMFLRPTYILKNIYFPPQILVALKHTIDFSKVPKINENELSEQFIRGGGPGGSAVNKNANCVVLTHLPTGTVIKCHISRCQDENRKMAREMLIEKLDEELNGEDSVVSQKKRIEEKKYKRTEYKKKKMAKLKSEWKKREGLE